MNKLKRIYLLEIDSCFLLVESEGLEPSSWNNPTFKRLQFSFTLDKTIPLAKTTGY